MKFHSIGADWTAQSLAFHTQAVLQGAFILAKAKGDAEIAAASIDHLRRYIELLFQPATPKGKEPSLARTTPISLFFSAARRAPA